jgi:hypothetical protein
MLRLQAPSKPAMGTQRIAPAAKKAVSQAASAGKGIFGTQKVAAPQRAAKKAVKAAPALGQKAASTAKAAASSNPFAGLFGTQKTATPQKVAKSAAKAAPAPVRAAVSKTRAAASKPLGAGSLASALLFMFSIHFQWVIIS